MNDKQILFSIVIPAFNEANYLPACLESCLKQQGDFSYEIIVVDNNSTDNTFDLAKSFGVRVTKEEKSGVGAARRRGTAEAVGEYIVNIDADTHLPKNYLLQIKNIFDKDNDLVCLGGQFYFYDGKRWQNWLRPVLFRLARGLAFICSWGKIGPIANNMIFRKAIYDKTDGFDSSLHYGEDGNLTKKLSKFGKIRVNMSLKCFVSARRFSRINKNFYLYFWNAIWVVIFGRPYKNGLEPLIKK